MVSPVFPLPLSSSRNANSQNTATSHADQRQRRGGFCLHLWALSRGPGATRQSHPEGLHVLHCRVPDRRLNAPPLFKQVLGVAQPIHSTESIWRRATELEGMGARFNVKSEVIIVDQTPVFDQLSQVVETAVRPPSLIASSLIASSDRFLRDNRPRSKDSPLRGASSSPTCARPSATTSPSSCRRTEHPRS